MAIRHLAYDLDFLREEILEIFQSARRLKAEQKRGQFQKLLEGKSLAMIFEKPSTRTRVSFEVAMTQLGGHALNLAAGELQLGRGETIADTAKVLSRYVDGIMARVFNHRDIMTLVQNSTVPVINGLSDKFHPCQALTDLFTVWEKKKSLKNLTISYVGDGNNNVTNSLLLLCARLGVNFKIGCPEEYKTEKEILDLAQKEVVESKAKIEMSSGLPKLLKGADVIYTDTWASMGKEEEIPERIKILKPYQVDRQLVALGKKDVMVMHCLPAHRGQEITDEVMDGPHSIIFEQAENRLHVQKAILVKLLRN